VSAWCCRASSCRTSSTDLLVLASPRWAVWAGGSHSGGLRCASTPLRCSRRGSAAELAAFALLSPLKQLRRACSRSTLRVPPPALRFSPPQRSPPTHTAQCEPVHKVERQGWRTNAISAWRRCAPSTPARTARRACWWSWPTARRWRACCCRATACACPPRWAARWAACSA
jgi:hypothetical protein